MFESAKRPSELALPENEIRNAAIPASRQTLGERHQERAILVRGHAVADDDDGTADLGARVIGVVEALARPVAYDGRHGVHRGRVDLSPAAPVKVQARCRV